MIINTFLFALFILSIILTFKYRFRQLNFIKESRKVLKRERSAYLTFLMTLANHIGAGNIVGVTTALIYGGPGSLFWMWISCFFTSIFSLIENTLAVKYREVILRENRGGTCYYIKKGLHASSLAMVFSIFLILTNTIFFGPLQVNTVSESIIIPFGVNKNIIFIILLTISFLIIFRGTKNILKFVEWLVPLMTFVFLLISSITILYNISRIPNVIVMIIKDAFDFQSITGALLGGSMIIGLKRSSFSNEAGLGTAPTISAMSKVEKPLEQAYVQVLGVFVDTALMCTLMGLMILVYNIDLNGFKGCTLAIYIFEVIFGNWGIYLGAFLLFSFAVSTWVSSYYAGESNILWFAKSIKWRGKGPIYLYKMLYILGLIAGVYSTSKAVWDYIDYGLVFLGSINIYAILKLQKDFKVELSVFESKKLLKKG